MSIWREILSALMPFVFIISNFIGAISQPAKVSANQESLHLTNGESQPTGYPILLQSDVNGVRFEYETPDFQIENLALPTGLYHQIQLPNASATSAPGYPQLPLISVLVGVPPDALVSLTTNPGEEVQLEGTYDLAPAPSPLPLESDLQPGTMDYPINPMAYGRTGFYPAAAAEITGDAWIRNQRVIRVAIYPFQYDPVGKTLLWHPNLQVALDFRGGYPNLGCADCLGDQAFESAPGPRAAQL